MSSTFRHFATQVEDACAALADVQFAHLSARKLGERVAQQSAFYTRDDAAELSQAERHDARLRFFSPRDMWKMRRPITELLRRGFATDKSLRILDIGAGFGATSLGALAAIGVSDGAYEIHALDVDGSALSLMKRLFDQLELENVRLQTSTGGLRKLPSGKFDLIVAGLVWNEAGKSAEALAEWLLSLRAKLNEGGAIVVVEPGGREPSQRLQMARDTLLGSELETIAPCISNAPCPILANERDWCRTEEALELSPRLASIAESAGLRSYKLSYSYLVLRQSGASLLLNPDARRVVSKLMISKGRREALLCRDTLVKVHRLDRHESERNDAFDFFVRGDLCELSGLEDRGKSQRILSDSDVIRYVDHER